MEVFIHFCCAASKTHAIINPTHYTILILELIAMIRRLDN